MSSREKKVRRKFTSEFREQAVKRVLSGHAVAAVARELDIGESLLHNWVTRHRLHEGNQSKHTLPVAPNLLEQDFTATAPNQKWVSDLTYIWTEEGWLYLAVVLDLYSRTVVGWSMSERMTRDVVIAALTMAVFRRRPGRGLIIHSDRGSQYAAHDYQRLLENQGFRCSMSKQGDCYDNAAMESFFHTLKVEQVNHCRYRTREAARADVFEYIETYYNRKRRHSHLQYFSPRDFEIQMAA